MLEWTDNPIQTDDALQHLFRWLRNLWSFRARRFKALQDRLDPKTW